LPRIQERVCGGNKKGQKNNVPKENLRKSKMNFPPLKVGANSQKNGREGISGKDKGSLS